MSIKLGVRIHLKAYRGTLPMPCLEGHQNSPPCMDPLLVWCHGWLMCGLPPSGFPLQGTIQAPRYIPDAFGRFALSPGSVCFLIARTYVQDGKTYAHHPALNTNRMSVIRESSQESLSQCESLRSILTVSNYNDEKVEEEDDEAEGIKGREVSWLSESSRG